MTNKKIAVCYGKMERNSTKDDLDILEEVRLVTRRVSCTAAPNYAGSLAEAGGGVNS